jgi:hypothetical protein
MFQGKFKVPSYYKDFSCKGKDCRNCCCQGWRITLTQDEYFHLLNEECSPYLKERIDTYVGILPHPSVEEYAIINFNYLGQCPLRLENGYCGLQTECGEENIPSVCRYYPRGPRCHPNMECSISNSCEWVIERLISSKEPYSFEEMELAFHFEDHEDDFQCDENLRQNLFDILNGDESLKVKLTKIALLLDGENLSEEELNKTLPQLKTTFSRSVSISSLLENCSEGTDILKLHKLYPELDSWISRILMNHIFYLRYPFIKGIKKPGNCLLCLVGFYLWILSNNCHGETNEFVDVTSLFFRVGEHSNIYMVISSLLSR